MSEEVRSGHAALDRSAGLAGALAYVMVGVLPVLTGLSLSAWWWVAWAVGLPVFAVDVLVDLRPSVARRLILVMVLVGSAIYVLEPLYGFGGVPLVITAASAGMVLPLSGALGVVAVQAVVQLVLGYRLEQEVGLLGPVFFIALQIFAVMTGQIAQREITARERMAQVHESLRKAHADLASAHVSLEAAQARLSETSRTEERLRISRDLHDLVGHQLSALALNLEVAGHLVEGPAAAEVARSRVIAKDLLADVRQVVSRLREEAPDVRQSLERMAAVIPRPAVHLDVDGAPAISSGPVREAVTLSVQEALMNSVRHSSADNAWVLVSRNGGGLEIEVRDDGLGASKVRPGNGLTGMRERIEALGGTVTLDGDDGFRVRIMVPLSESTVSSAEPSR